MSKVVYFKVGDVVEVVKIDREYPWCVGQSGIVVEVDDEPELQYGIDSMGWWIPHRLLKLVREGDEITIRKALMFMRNTE